MIHKIILRSKKVEDLLCVKFCGLYNSRMQADRIAEYLGRLKAGDFQGVAADVTGRPVSSTDPLNQYNIGPAHTPEEQLTNLLVERATEAGVLPKEIGGAGKPRP